MPLTTNQAHILISHGKHIRDANQCTKLLLQVDAMNMVKRGKCFFGETLRQSFLMNYKNSASAHWHWLKNEKLRHTTNLDITNGNLSSFNTRICRCRHNFWLDVHFIIQFRFFHTLFLVRCRCHECLVRGATTFVFVTKRSTFTSFEERN